MNRPCLPAQLVVASLSTAVVIAGFTYTIVTSPVEEPVRLDLGFLGLLSLSLLPTVTYLLGVRSCSMVLVFGACLFVPTAGAWLLYLLSSDALAGVVVLYAVAFTFLTSVIGTLIDRTLSEPRSTDRMAP